MACRRGVAPLPADLETAMLLLHHRHVERAAGLAPAIFSLGRRRVAPTLRPQMDRLTGVAPASSGWKPDALLLSYRRKARHALEDFVPLAYTRFLSVWRPGIEVGEAHPSRMGLPFRSLSFQPDFQVRRAPTRRGFLAQGPGRSRWRPESLASAHRPSPVGGYNKKTPASFRARGLSFFSGLYFIRPSPPRPSVRWFDSRRACCSSPGNTNPRTETRPADGGSLPSLAFDLGRRVLTSRKVRLLVSRSCYMNNVAAERFGVKRKKIEILEGARTLRETHATEVRRRRRRHRLSRKGDRRLRH